jgi:hypothetical protein
MAEQELNGSHIGARFQQMHRESVAQRMGRHGLVQAGLAPGLLTGEFDRIFGDRLAGHITGEQPLLRSHQTPVAA